jgi:acylphosphatase
MSEPWIARRCRVTGRVQGVYYRASTASRATELGVSGEARNLPDGSVEVIACGDAEAVALLIEWLWIGPTSAKVIDVQVDEAVLDSGPPPQGFRTA